MNSTRNPRVKICCISSVEEALLAIRHGAAALGLVSEMPSGPGVIEEHVIAEISAAIPPPISSFLLTSRQAARVIVEQQRRTGVSTLQICDRLDKDGLRYLRAQLPGIRLVQVVHVTGDRSCDEAVDVAPLVDALLLDSGNQSLPVKELGGTGRVHDWSVSRRIREQVSIPIFLAGGLTPENVPQAIHEVGPFGLDVCSGVRTDGRLDGMKLRAFFEAAQSAGTVNSER
jgi:phosphoribosylanthranilate isomerase